jgi:hypothetical protein
MQRLLRPHHPLLPRQIAEKKNKGGVILTATICDSILSRYMDEPDNLVIWRDLKKVHQSNSAPCRMLLKKKLFAIRFPERQSMTDNFREVSTAVGELAAIGVTVDDQEVVDLVLSTLPPSWETFATVIAGRATAPTFTDLETLITSEETCRSNN